MDGKTEEELLRNDAKMTVARLRAAACRFDTVAPRTAKSGAKESRRFIVVDLYGFDSDLLLRVWRMDASGETHDYKLIYDAGAD